MNYFNGHISRTTDLNSYRNQANYVRFFSHLVLFFRGLGQSQSIQQPNLPLEACTKVIDAYVQILQLNDEPELVALYASQLQADNAVEAYAQFLACEWFSNIRILADGIGQTAISAESSRSERQQALSRTREHDLDFASVAIRTTQIIIETSLSPPELNRDLLFSPELPESAAIESLVRSLEWLSFDRATYVEALLQSNALIRWFMSQCFSLSLSNSAD